MYGYSDENSDLYCRIFSFYQTIGCRHKAACLTPSASRHEDVPYYRDFSEPRETRLYFRGFALGDLRKYAATYSNQSECDICAVSSRRRLVPTCQF